MKMSNIFKGAMVGVLALSMASCQDFLNRPTEDNYNVDNFYKTDDLDLEDLTKDFEAMDLSSKIGGVTAAK